MKVLTAGFHYLLFRKERGNQPHFFKRAQRDVMDQILVVDRVHAPFFHRFS